MSQTVEITRDDLIRFENLLTTAIHDAAIRQDGDHTVALSVIFAEFEADFDNFDNGIVSLNDVAWSEHFTAYEALLDAKPAPVINVLTDVISARSVIGLFEALRDGQIRLMFDDGQAIAERYLAETGITFGGGDYYEHMSFIMIWVYFMTGIRVSEGLALTWKDINFNSKQLSITHSLTRLNADDVKVFGDLKTISSERIISLDDDTIALLKDWKTIQKAHGAHSLVMSYNDKPLYRSTVARIIKRHAQLAHVPVIEGKELRHSHVSYLINEFNADVLIVSKRLGHSDPSISLKHYGHLWHTNDQQLTDKMTGNIQINTAKSKLVHFNGNQHIRKK